MKTSVIRHRVADFLKRFPPFDALSQEDLLELAGSGKVRFHESEEFLFRQGESLDPFVWIIQQGRVELLEAGVLGEKLRDVLGEGDILGLDRFVGEDKCLYSARTATDVIFYGVAAAPFESLIDRYPAVRQFLSAHLSVSGNFGFKRRSWLDTPAPPIEFLRARLCELPVDASTSELGTQLSNSRNEVVALVDDRGYPVGTVTALDLIAASPGPVLDVARPAPPTATAPLSARVALRRMLEARHELLAVTADGTPESALQAILTASELALFCGHNPIRLVNAIRNAASTAELVPLIEQASRLRRETFAQPNDVDDCCEIDAEVLAAMAEASIRMAGDALKDAGLPVSDARFCWVLFGAAARGNLPAAELPTIAAIYDDSSAENTARDSMYFASLVGETAERFHALGITGSAVPWPKGCQPSMPLSEWKRLFSETVQNPLSHNLYERRSFFDMRPLFGDQTIFHELQSHILQELDSNEIAIPLLANDTLNRVPLLTFFGGYVLDSDGVERDSFDIIEALVAPVANAARVFALASRRLNPASTLAHLDAAAQDRPDGTAIFREAADAFRIGLFYSALVGSVCVQPGKLTKFDQLLLKSAFSAVQRFLEFTVSTFVPAI